MAGAQARRPPSSRPPAGRPTPTRRHRRRPGGAVTDRRRAADLGLEMVAARLVARRRQGPRRRQVAQQVADLLVEQDVLGARHDGSPSGRWVRAASRRWAPGPRETGSDGGDRDAEGDGGLVVGELRPHAQRDDLLLDAGEAGEVDRGRPACVAPRRAVRRRRRRDPARGGSAAAVRARPGGDAGARVVADDVVGDAVQPRAASDPPAPGGRSRGPSPVVATPRGRPPTWRPRPRSRSRAGGSSRCGRRRSAG